MSGPLEELDAGSLLSPFTLTTIHTFSIHYNNTIGELLINSILLFSFCFIFFFFLCSRESCQLRFASNGRTTAPTLVRGKTTTILSYFCVYFVYCVYYTLHTHHASLRGVHPQQFPALTSPATNSHVTAKVHRAFPKTPEGSSTHQDFVSGTATGPRTGHGPS